MESPPVPKLRPAGLPPGVQAGPLGRRFVAYLIDSVAPGAFVVAGFGIADTVDPGAELLWKVLALVVGLDWALLVWWMFATKSAGPGMRLMKLQLVGLSDGRPLGWFRYLRRTVVMWLLTASGIGLVVLVVQLLQDRLHLGPPDRVVNSVVIVERAKASARPGNSGAGAAIQQQDGDPPQLRSQDQREPTSTGSVTDLPPQPVASGAEPQPAPAGGLQPEPASGGGPEQEPASAGGPEQEPAPAGGPALEPAPADVAELQLAADGRPLDEGWMVGLDDGRELPIIGVVLLGRNPQGRPGEEVELVKVADPTRTVSKTHLAIGVDAYGIYVMDRGSTNGSSVTSAGGVSTPCPPGDVIGVSEGNVVSFGDHWLEIRRASPTQ